MTGEVLHPRDLHWAEDDLGLGRGSYPARYLTRGLEADVIALGEPPVAVLKRWFVPGHDVATESLLLRRLFSALPVPQPLGWGWDDAGRPVLAMRYAGEALTAVTAADAHALGAMLAAIHAVDDLPSALDSDADSAALAGRLIPDTAPGDLAALRDAVTALLPPLGAALTHGDYHPGNILRRGDVLSVADWSGARRSDPHYDLAWTLLLLSIYHGEQMYPVVLHGYRSGAPLPDLGPFEILAGLRWVYLVRTAPVPVNVEWQIRADQFLRRRLPDTLRPLLPQPPSLP